MAESTIHAPRIKDSLLNPRLPTRIIANMKKSLMGSNTSCVQLFICRMSPLIWGVQVCVLLSRIVEHIENKSIVSGLS
jgi:hypothetical protein